MSQLLSDKEKVTLSDEERERLSAEQLARCTAISKKMLAVLANHVAEIEISEDEKKVKNSVEPIVEEILKLQREDGMMLIDRETVKVMFLMAGAVISQLLEKHYDHAFSDIVEFKIGKPRYELTMQDLRDGLEERAAALASKKE